MTFKNTTLLKQFALIVAYMFVTACSIHEIDFNPEEKITIPEGYSFSSDRYEDVNVSRFWYDEFSDSKLSELIKYAYKNNYDIDQSIARIKAARALRESSTADLYPELYFEADYSRRFEDHDQQNSSQTGLTLSWEIDLFNKLENIEKSDILESEALVEDLEALKLTLGSEIAISYYGALSGYESVKLLRKQVELNEKYLKLVNLRFEQGIATNLEVLQQKAQVANSKSLIPTALATIRSYENKIDILLGHVPDAKARIDDNNSILDIAVPLNTGMPSDLLLFRPDLRAQIKRLISADADIAVAMAERLPSLTLGAGGYYSDSSNYSGALGLLSASLVQPLLDWGERKAEVERNKALYEEELALFGSLYLQALEEVETAIYNEKQQVEYLRRLKTRRDILEQTVKEAQLQYLEGVSDYLPVINALVELHTVERSLISAKYQLILYRITLHRALGSRIREKKEA